MEEVFAVEPQTLSQALLAAAHAHPTGGVCHLDAAGHAVRESYRQLIHNAKALASDFKRLGFSPGDRIVFQLEASQPIVSLFWGCQWAGLVPAVAAVPSGGSSSRAVDALVNLCKRLQPRAIISSHELGERGRWVADQLATQTQWLAYEDLAKSTASGDELQPVQVSSNDVALLTLTSGSTGAMKCIELTHANLISRAVAANKLGRQSANDIAFNWLPFDHIGTMSDWHIRCILAGCQIIFAPKETVMADPLRWIDWLSQHKVTHSWAPNFAYALVANAVKKSPYRQWDLSNVQGLLTAGETVSPQVVERFTSALAIYGLKNHAMRPAFGMAETGSGITYRVGSEAEPLRTRWVQRTSIGSAIQAGKPNERETQTVVSLGQAIEGVTLRVVNENGQALPENHLGQLHVQGSAVARGYFDDPEANKAFRSDGWFDTGDLGFLADGELYLTGRAKDSIIVNGANYYCAELEAIVETVEGVEPTFAVACATAGDGDTERLAIFASTNAKTESDRIRIQRAIRRRLVEQSGLSPSIVLLVPKSSIPKTAIGKLQRRQLAERLAAGEFAALIEQANSELAAADAKEAVHVPESEVQAKVAAIWKETLNRTAIGLDQNVFELGASSILLAQLHSKIEQAFERTISIVDMFKYPTVRTLAEFLGDRPSNRDPLAASRERAKHRQNTHADDNSRYVAVIGMAARFPGARTLDEFWRNLCGGVESIARFSTDEVLASGVAPSRARDPRYVAAGPVLEGVENFDAEFFGYTPREAELLDPQQRLFLECCWEAFEDAGYNPLTSPDAVGIYAGAMLNTYLLNHVLPAGKHATEAEAKMGGAALMMPDSLTGFLTMVGNDKDYLTTRVSYKLNLRGPSINVQTACSTSLVAVHMAAASVLAGECDMALAGGVSVKTPQQAGYLYEDDLIASPDGHCRPFDAQAQGTIFGNGAGVVLLKRLDRALADGDHIYAVVKGSAINNDGGVKAGYMAPSELGQAAVTAESLFAANVDPRTIGLVEAHGTATPLGDPIEVAGLAQAFRQSTADNGFCALGSVKGNVGHLQIASGIAGFIKAVLAIDRQAIPPTLHFATANPKIDFANSPFFVNTKLLPWKEPSHPRRASVNSLGIGGANAHVVLEEAPQTKPLSNASSSPRTLTLSARTATALVELASKFEAWLRAHPSASIADVAFTASTGRVPFSHRLAVTGKSATEWADQLQSWAAAAPETSAVAGLASESPTIVFHFSGEQPEVLQGTNELYRDEPAYKAVVERCLSALSPVVANEVRTLITSGSSNDANSVSARLAAITAQYALASLWLDWCLSPAYVTSDDACKQVASAFAGEIAIDDLLKAVENGTAIESIARRAPRIPLSGPTANGSRLPVKITVASSDRNAIAETLARLFVAGASIDWRKVAGGARRVSLPTYPFQRQRYWIDRPKPAIEAQPHHPNGNGVKKSGANGNGNGRHGPTNGNDAKTNGVYSPDEFARETPRQVTGNVPTLDTLRQKLADALPRDRKSLITNLLRQQLAQALGVSVEKIPLDRGFSDLGVDSLTAVELRNRLQQSLDHALPVTLLFDHPTVMALAGMLTDLVDRKVALPPPSNVRAASAPAPQPLPSTTPVASQPPGDPKKTGSAAVTHVGARTPPVLEAKRTERMTVNIPPTGKIEPLAIIGIACRLPGGVDKPEKLWTVLHEGVCTTSEIPADRWDIDAYYSPDRSLPGKMATRSGSFINDIVHFDPQFFGVARREANALDPQQRLLLEVSWEAFENAGIQPEKLAGSQTGVFLGLCGVDYSLLTAKRKERITPYFGTGTSSATACGRLSYFYGLNGPCFSIDTACSSSLVSAHQAFHSLSRGECDLALIGGSNMVIAPEPMITFSKAQMLAVDGKCKTFDASADGYVRGEGVIIMLVKRLSDALRAGDNIWCVVKGSAVNQDGRSNGLTAPSATAQEAVIRTALDSAGLRPDQISYLEAHGTGTPLGDSIELSALDAVFGGRDKPLTIGSLKTNLGHTEAVSGVNGMLKVILAMNHQRIPRHLHFNNPNPNAHWESFHVPTEEEPWNVDEGKRWAGISSFGFGGTNAHVILEEPPARTRVPLASQPRSSGRPVHLLPISAKHPQALTDLAARYAETLQAAGTNSLEAICAAAATTRSDMGYRLAIVANSTAEAVERLQMVAKKGLAAASEIPGVASGEAGETSPKLAMLFTGQGSQYVGMAKQLYENQPVFRRTLDRCDELLRPWLPDSLLSQIYPTGSESALDQTAFTQPALFAIEYSLFELWKSWGIEPDVVLGHSVGEYVAACAAGVFDLEDGLRLIAARAQLVQSLPPGGEMHAIMATQAWVEEAIRGSNGKAHIAAVNGPKQVVISGEHDAVAKVVAKAQAEGIRVSQLTVSHAFHSHLLDPILDDFLTEASSVRFHKPNRTIISNLTGQPAGDEIATPEYWRDHLRHAVLFAKGIQAAADLGCQVFIEAGPKAVLSAMGRICLPDPQYLWLPSLSSPGSDWQTILSSVARWYAAGGKVAWDKLYDPRLGRGQKLPNYAFQRQKYWLEEPLTEEEPSSAGGSGGTATGHPILGRRIALPRGQTMFEGKVGTTSPFWLVDHQVEGYSLFPASGFLEVLFAAGNAIAPHKSLKIEDAQFHRGFPPQPDRNETVQILVSPVQGAAGKHKVEFFRQVEHVDGPPTEMHHASGVVTANDHEHESLDLDAIRARCDKHWDAKTYYEDLWTRGLQFGYFFQSLKGIDYCRGEALARWEAPNEIANDLGNYLVHPAILDTAFQVVGAAGDDRLRKPFLPAGVEKVEYFGSPSKTGLAYARIRYDESPEAEGLVVADVILADDEGRILAKATRFKVRRVVSVAERMGVKSQFAPWLHGMGWRPVAFNSAATFDRVGTWLIVTDEAAGDSAASTALAKKLSQEDQQAVVARLGSKCQRISNDEFEVRPGEVEDFRQLLRDLSDGVRPQLRGILFLSGPTSTNETAPPDVQPVLLRGLLNLIHATSGSGTTAGLAPTARLVVATRGAMSVVEGDRVPAVAQGSLWGLGGTSAGEYPEARVTRVDLDPADSADEVVEALWCELAAGEASQQDAEFQVAWRGGQRYGARMTRQKATTVRMDRPDEPFRLAISSYGALENLRLAASPRRVPGPGEIEIEVDASGLNFRDVLRALGMLQEFEAPLGITSAETAPFGFECAGRVVALGPDVTDFTIGQDVVAVATGALASHVTVAARQCAVRPQEISAVEAATLPLPFLTALYGLEKLAQIKPGQKVLIHAAAGGVGQAAVQLAMRSGAEVFATASPGKWEFLEALGVKHIYNSRTTDFSAAIMKDTDGKGVDVVLNSLNGEFIEASLNCLAQGGAFVEIGKIGIWTRELMARRRPDVVYFPFDLGDEERAAPGFLGRLLNELMPRMASRELSPLPHRLLGIEQAVTAFRHVAQGRHRGKVVLGFDRPQHGVRIRQDGCYLVTGGFGGLGLQVAKKLASIGAKQLVLIGREGAKTPEQQQAVAEIEALGTKVHVAKGDVSNADSLAAALASLPSPLRGIVHSAGVLDDGTIRQLTWDRFEKVLAPKVAGAWNLHKATAGMGLDFFVCFSSAAGLLGATGQGNYASANQFLDALAHYRRAAGLPGQSLDWGPWAEAGMAARMDARNQQRLAAMGMQQIPLAGGLEVFVQMLADDLVQTAIVPIDWNRFLQNTPAIPFFQELRPKSQGRGDGSAASPAAAAAPAANSEALEELKKTPVAQRQAKILEIVRTTIGAVLGFSAESVPPRGRLFDLGLDSLTAVELQNRLQRGLQVVLPATVAFDHPTVEALAKHLLTLVQLGPEPEAPAKPAAASPPMTATNGHRNGHGAEKHAEEMQTPEESSAENLDQYSDAEVEAMLREKYLDKG